MMTLNEVNKMIEIAEKFENDTTVYSPRTEAKNLEII